MSEASSKLGLKLDTYRAQLIAEEKLSQMMKPPQKYHHWIAFRIYVSLTEDAEAEGVEEYRILLLLTAENGKKEKKDSLLYETGRRFKEGSVEHLFFGFLLSTENAYQIIYALNFDINCYLMREKIAVGTNISARLFLFFFYVLLSFKMVVSRDDFFWILYF